ncbi:TadE/TadG family type IV pilus assembly protein [Evansella halocellulosilytica]|uniref:TadE/TadG family type IV pilus assembly protein n=1 Tax=Evansella halocellulosilytica TaxID=2011013 RepID=UPI000BB957D3|nr:pilus assembly protein [Evansella halocellulosilytica]
MTFKRDERGSFTIEASMLFPMILIITFCLIFFSLVVYYKAILQFEANRLADQITYVWSNSEKDHETGEFNAYTTADGGDGLYWRLTSNNFMEQFGLPNIGSGGLVEEKKRSELIVDMNGPVSGSVEFNNGLLGNEIQVTLEQSIPLPSMFTDILGMDVMQAQSTRTVTEPVEFIRNTDFVVYFTGKITDRVTGYFDTFNSN